jgi:hypothetical protein
MAGAIRQKSKEAPSKPRQQSDIFNRAWEHWYKCPTSRSGIIYMDFVVDFARKEVLRDRKRRKS